MTDKNGHTPAIKCGHCQNVAPMEVLATHRASTHEELATGEPYEQGTFYELIECPACKEVSLRSGGYHSHMEPEEWHARVIYPVASKPVTGLPDGVRTAYDAAQKVASIDPNAFAVLLGRVLDKVCIDRKAAGNTLHERLNDLAKRGEIPERLAEMGHRLRDLRNLGAHAELGELSEAEIPVLDALCRAVLEYVYSAPKLIEQVEKRLEKLKAAGKT